MSNTTIGDPLIVHRQTFRDVKHPSAVLAQSVGVALALWPVPQVRRVRGPGSSFGSSSTAGRLPNVVVVTAG